MKTFLCQSNFPKINSQLLSFLPSFPIVRSSAIRIISFFFFGERKVKEFFFQQLRIIFPFSAKPFCRFCSSFLFIWISHRSSSTHSINFIFIFYFRSLFTSWEKECCVAVWYTSNWNFKRNFIKCWCWIEKEIRFYFTWKVFCLDFSSACLNFSFK